MKTDPATDYGDTVSPETYISGIMVHIWLAAMYEIMIQQVVREVKDLFKKHTFTSCCPLLILDIGCGPGHFTIALAQRIWSEIDPIHRAKIHIIGIDKSRSFIDYGQSELTKHLYLSQMVSFSLIDIMSSGIGIDPAQIITTSGFFHHFTDEEKPKVMAQIASMLVANGILIDGDEHPAPKELYEEACAGKSFDARQATLFALYLQVIDGAKKVGHDALRRAEIENLIAEVYRNEPGGPPNVPEEWLFEWITDMAENFMPNLLKKGTQSIVDSTELTMSEIERMSLKTTTSPKLFDRGDFKDCLHTHLEKLWAQGFSTVDIFDTGNCDIIGSAPVVVFRKK